ncbi:MAG: iron complex outerrane recepter protein [Sphingomonadales bacterium]|nr:iron complex outerrane recepter protein [Sphingomonadales bacterium]
MNRAILPAAIIAVALPSLLAAAPSSAEVPIVITFTRQPEPDATLPAAETVISGDDIRARGATDLRGALDPVAGVEVLPGSDGGPASGVVAFQGLAELDAYLLVVDGVPFGGAFNPATATLDLIDIDRIEVVRGAAPVTYGATSFVGVIHVIRPEAGQQPTRAMLQAGTRDSARAAFATTLSGGAFGQSLLGSLETRKFSQDRGKFSRGHLLYRAATDVGGGRLHLDLEGITLDQTPYSPHPREGSGLSGRFPRDANINPSDARADQDRLQANVGYDISLGDGVIWSSMLSTARTWTRNTRGFLRTDFDATGATSNADGFRQRIRMTDVYADTHVGRTGAALDWVVGADWLYGKGSQHSANFEYAVLPDGSNAPDSHSLHIDESTVLNDRRSFAGIYAQVIARPLPALTLLGGLRLNRTDERRCGGQADGSDTPQADECQSRKKTRLAGSVGASYAVLRSDRATVSAFADYRDTYKPAAIDFGPEAEGDILEPETAQSWEAGLKAERNDGRLHAEVSYFDTRFRNLVIRENIGGLPGLASAGRERFRGIEGEIRWMPIESLTLSGSYAHHLARFTDYERLQPDGSLQQLAGNRLELSPRDLASAIVTFAPANGLQASATLRYVGSRFLNKSNTVKTGAYAMLDARAGWKFANKWGVFVEGENLTDRRDPVTESELGDAQFYRLPGRRILATLSYGF